MTAPFWSATVPPNETSSRSCARTLQPHAKRTSMREALKRMKSFERENEARRFIGLSPEGHFVRAPRRAREHGRCEVQARGKVRKSPASIQPGLCLWNGTLHWRGEAKHNPFVRSETFTLWVR